MAADDNLFQEAPEETAVDPSKDWAAELIGEDKPYKDVQAAARAIAEKEAFIQKILKEQADLRTDLSKRVTIEEFLDKMNSQREREPVTIPEGNEPEIPPAGLTEESAARLIDDRLQKAREEDRRKANSTFVKKELEKQYGKGYLNVLRAKSDELGLSTDQMSNLAATAPKAFLEMVLKNPVDVPGVTPPRSVVNSGGYSPKTEKGWSYYEKIRKENPRLYWSPKMQNEIHREAQRQGLEFLQN